MLQLDHELADWQWTVEWKGAWRLIREFTSGGYFKTGWPDYETTGEAYVARLKTSVPEGIEGPGGPYRRIVVTYGTFEVHLFQRYDERFPELPFRPVVAVPVVRGSLSTPVRMIRPPREPGPRGGVARFRVLTADPFELDMFVVNNLAADWDAAKARDAKVHIFALGDTVRFERSTGSPAPEIHDGSGNHPVESENGWTSIPGRAEDVASNRKEMGGLDLWRVRVAVRDFGFEMVLRKDRVPGMPHVGDIAEGIAWFAAELPERRVAWEGKAEELKEDSG